METKLETTEILKDFHIITGARISLHDLDFNEVAAYPKEISPFCKIIQSNTKGRTKCQTADQEAFLNVRRTGQPVTYKCHCGLIETVAPIFNYGILTGYFMMGQISDDNPNRISNIKKASAEYTFEPCDSVIAKIPAIKDELMLSFINILKIIAQFMTDTHRMTVKDRNLPHAVKHYIDKFYAKPLNITALCETFGCSRTTLINSFKEKYGITIGNYISEYRLDKAKMMLEAGGDSIKAIASDCGFPDQNYFTKIFRNRFNMTPTKYKNTVKCEPPSN